MRYTWATMQPIKDQAIWNSIIASIPESHLLQTQQWAQVKMQVGWQPIYRIWGDASNPDAAALILLRTISLGGLTARLKVMYIPKGPLLRDWGNVGLRCQVLDDLISLARQESAVFLKIDPDIPLGDSSPQKTRAGLSEGDENSLGAAVLEDLSARGFRFSGEQIQFRNTVLVDLSPDEDEILARMKQKTRYNIRLAGRKGVTVRIGSSTDLNLLYRMYAETSLRDGFTISG